MSINNLKDLKDYLIKVPDEVLEIFVVGQSEDGHIGLGCDDGEDESEMIENWSKHTKKYPALLEISKYIQNIGVEALNEDSDGEPITSENNLIDEEDDEEMEDDEELEED